MTSYRTRNDVICAKNARWFRSTNITHKQFIFSTLSLKLQWHTRIYGETFHVTVAQTTQNIWKFMVGKSSLQEIATLAIIREISDSNLETGRYSLKSGVSRIIRESWQHCKKKKKKKLNSAYCKCLVYSKATAAVWWPIQFSLFILDLESQVRKLQFFHTFSVILKLSNYRKCMGKSRLSKNWSRTSLHSRFCVLFLWTRKLLFSKRKNRIYEFRKK